MSFLKAILFRFFSIGLAAILIMEPLAAAAPVSPMTPLPSASFAAQTLNLKSIIGPGFGRVLKVRPRHTPASLLRQFRLDQRRPAVSPRVLSRMAPVVLGLAAAIWLGWLVYRFQNNEWLVLSDARLVAGLSI